jgi:hypothetical protein
MSNIFTEVVAGFEWLGKELVDAPAQIKSVISIVDDVKNDADTLFPDVTMLIDDVDAVATAAVKDSGAGVAAAEALVQAIVAAAQADAINIPDDIAVGTALKNLILVVTASGAFADVLAANKKLVTDYDTLGSDVKAAWAKLKTDA